ncbi:iron-containing redox enzyme family protein [Methyloprofundus sp.]|uniref:iron-containing redox enzyme family protein n=1 Tax=Methyloprofundus sp. TaxID=2020875 RepID=UPI003D0AC5E6
MNKSEHAFDPALGLLYTQQLESARNLPDKAALGARQLFYLLNQSGNNQQVMPDAYAFVSESLNELNPAYQVLQDSEQVDGWVARLIPPEISPLPKSLQTPDNFCKLTHQLAAIQLTSPCWLENISQIACSKTKVTVTVMSIYLQLVGAGQQGADITQLYRALLLSCGHEPPVLHSYDYCQQAEWVSETFEFACIQLALARFPRVLFAEILGFTLAYCQMPTLLESCFPDQPEANAFYALSKQQARKQLLPLQACISSYLALFPGQKQPLWQRIQNGFWLYHRQMQSCRDGLQQFLASSLSTQQAAIQLLQQKASAAIGHHQKIQLQGKPLDTWFAELPENSHAFLQALIESDYVNQQNPEASLLLKLFDFKGPMFGVLDQSELEIIKNWISLSLNEQTAYKLEEPKGTSTSESEPAPVIKQAQNHYAKLSNRELYYYLANADLFPDVLATAQKKVRHCLQACAWFNGPPFKHYSHQQLDRYIDAIYQQEMGAYQPLQGEPKISREAYVWGLEQIAPMILIDGCWLQNSLAVQHAHPEISEILFKIYCDEVGNGVLEQNHPYIFQQLLQSLAIKLPPVHSRSFVEHPGFINSAFDLPVYMLSLSSFSAEFLPELLGLNMAIELSGLGKSYMSLVDDWNYWGIDPSIANIHISIDNAASGHTFLAKKTIKLYMDEILNQSADRSLLDQHWRRIYSGYASLRFVGGRFKLSLPVGYLCNKFSVKNRQ